jgi:hypothetical protein
MVFVKYASQSGTYFVVPNNELQDVEELLH